jgi:hypothetical protein
VRNAIFTAKLNHGRRSRHAQSRFLRSGLVVNTRVDDAAVVSTLVAGDAIFLLQDQQPELRKAARNFQRNRKADYASSDDDCVVAGFGHSGFGQVSHTSIARNRAVVNSSREITDHRSQIRPETHGLRMQIVGNDTGNPRLSSRQDDERDGGAVADRTGDASDRYRVSRRLKSGHK